MAAIPTAGPQGVERRLAAILNADVEGYSRLMADDEAATVRTLTAYRDAMATAVRRHRGRVVDATGDNVLAEFASVVDAVECAVAVQRELAERNATLPVHRRMQFRIGVNLGDVIVEGDRIYGDGVNVAARVQALAEPGGVAISGTAYDQVETKLRLGYEDLGRHAVKNIPQPVRVYRVRLEPGPPVRETTPTATVGARRRRPMVVAAGLALLMAAGGAVLWTSTPRPAPPLPGLELPDKPSIAVLPFANLSGDPRHEPFTDGMTEELITTLSRVSGLFVIASTSSFTYKGRPAKVQEVSRELGVQYVLEGSIRRSEDRVRVTAQLIDASTGRHLWAERYDRVLQDVFAVQDEIAQRIVIALEVKLTEGVQARRRWTTTSVEAREVYQQALERSRVGAKDANAEARRLLERAVELDPQFAAAWTLIGFTHMLDAWIGWSTSPAQSLARAQALAEKAIAMDGSLGEPYVTLGMVYLLRRQHDQAVAAVERVVELSPNAASAQAYRALILALSGRPEEAIEAARKAMRLAPRYPAYFVLFLGQAYRAAGKCEEAIAAYRRWHELNPSGFPAYAGMALCYRRLGREAEARAAAAEMRKAVPSYTLAFYARANPYRNPADLEHDLADLRALGFK